MGDSNKKAALAGLASILLVAAVVAVAIGSTNKKTDIAISNKSVDAVCAPTDYKETCRKSLAGTNSTDPRELVELAIKATIDDISDVVKESAILKEAAKDKSTKDAFAVCDEVLKTAMHDLNRSVERISELDGKTVKVYVEDLKVWLSAVITNQETCIDAFENTTGGTGEKMKALLKTAKEMSSNGLAMVNEITSLLSSLNLGSFSSRKLLTDGEEERRNLLVDAVPNAVVAMDGSGQFNTVNAAIAAVPKKNNVTFVIYVKAGVYKEQVVIPKGANKIVMYGDGPAKTIISGSKNFVGGTKTYQSATVAVNADDFFARDITFENTAGPEGHQAVALRVSGDRAVFFNVHMYGYQDTLYTHTYRQFYRDCVISGTIDFIFGDALAIFQNCEFIVRKPMENQPCMVTAQGRIDWRSTGAIVIQNGTITAEPALLQAAKPVEAYLGRPWKLLSRTIIMSSNIDGFISPEGWAAWFGSFALDTLYYAEFQNRGIGSYQEQRVQWKGIQHISPEEAESWTAGRAFVEDYWIREIGIPYTSSMM